MRILQKITILFLATCLWISCSDDSEKATAGSNCSNTCDYTIASGETAGTTPSSLNGTYNLTYHSAQPGSPYTNGTTATFTISNNELTVEIDGNCITLKNPILRGQNNYLFIDNCDKNITYNVSPNSDGSFNEINIEPIGTGWLGQFS